MFSWRLLAQWNNSQYGRYVTTLRHIILIHSQPIFALASYCCVLSRAAANTNFLSLWFEPTETKIYHTQSQHADHYNTWVSWLYKISNLHCIYIGLILISYICISRCSHDRMVVPITTKVVSSNHADDEMYSIQHYVIKFDSDLHQVGGFPSPIKLTSTI